MVSRSINPTTELNVRTIAKNEEWPKAKHHILANVNKVRGRASNLPSIGEEVKKAGMELQQCSKECERHTAAIEEKRGKGLFGPQQQPGWFHSMVEDVHAKIMQAGNSDRSNGYFGLWTESTKILNIHQEWRN